MSIYTVSSLVSANPTLVKSQKPLFHPIPQIRLRTNPMKLKRVDNLSGFLDNNLPFHSKRFNLAGFMKARKDDLDKAAEEARGQSTMPDRFRPLIKQVPENPIRWPWFLGAAFALFAYRVVIWELYNWKKAAVAIVRFFPNVLKLLLAVVYYFIGDHITASIRALETTLYTIRAWYSWIIAYAPIPELTTIIILSSIILAISEATVPDSVNSQPYLLTVAGLIGFAAVKSYISEVCFWILLVGIFGFAQFVKKRDYMAAVMPVAAVLAAVGEPWVRIIVLVSYLGLAIFHHWKKQPDLDGEEEVEKTGSGVIRRTPVPLVCAALAIGVRLAAKWAGYRHLTWMIV